MTRHTRRVFCQGVAAGVGAVWTGGSLTAAAATSEEPGDWAERFCICNELFGDWPFEKAFAVAAECGYRGVEIAPFTIDTDVRRVAASRRQEIRRQAEKAGLSVVGLHWLLAKTDGFHLTSPEPAVRSATARYLGELARFVADLGGNLLIFGSPKQRNLLPGVSRAEAMGYATEVIERTLPVLEKTATTLALEPLSPRTTSFLKTAAEAAELIEGVDSPRCRLNLDCLAMSTESTPIPELIRANRATLAHFHANDPNAKGPGFGELDFAPIFRVLEEVDYRGWISVEVFNYSPGPERLARESIEYMRRCVPR